MTDAYEKLLAGLDDVDWAGMVHAYGSAADVPGQIRAVCGDDGTARDKAFRGLRSNIVHQGTRYSASPFAVPFLARIAVAGPPAAREDTLWLLTYLAIGLYGADKVSTGIDTVGWRAAVAEVTPEKMLPWYEEQLAVEADEQRREQLRETRDWVAAGNSPDPKWVALRSYDAVLGELPGLPDLLDDCDPRVRTRIAYLLAWFPEASGTTLPRLLVLAEREQDPVVVATALVAAGLIGTTALAADLAPYLNADEGLVRWAAATALVRIAGSGEGAGESGLLDRAVTELAEAAANPAPQPATDYNKGDFHGHIERMLHDLA